MTATTRKRTEHFTLIVQPGSRIPLGAGVMGHGYEIARSRDYDWNGLERGPSPMAIWQYTLSGKGVVLLDGVERAVTEGMAMVVEIPQEHRYYLPEDSDHWEFIWLDLEGRELMRIWRELTRRTGPAVTLPRDSKAVDTAERIMEKDRERALRDPYLNSEYAYRFLMQLVGELLPDAGDREKPGFVARVIDFCLNRIDRPISVEEMAAVAGYSKYHFNRLFKRHQGETPIAFLNRLKIDHAMRLLQTTRLSVKEIAGRCGFDDPSYFCKVFRKYRQESPREIRKRDR